jgi:hypothetical protein
MCCYCIVVVDLTFHGITTLMFHFAFEVMTVVIFDCRLIVIVGGIDIPDVLLLLMVLLLMII